MRPEILYPLFAPITALPGIGGRTRGLYERLAGPKVIDLCWHLPIGLIDRRFSPPVADAPDGVVVTLKVRVDEHLPPRNRKSPYRVQCSDDSGSLQLVFFHAKGDYLRRILPEGEERIVSGKIEHFGGQPQMTHPDHIVTVAEQSSLPAVEPVFPLTAGVSLKQVNRAVRGALERVPELPEWLDVEHVRRQAWPAWKTALLTVHKPTERDILEADSPARQRLAYDELLANQLALALVRERLRDRPGQATVGEGGLRSAVLSALPYQLTMSQQTAVDEIVADLESPSRMLRLLQGDVGSGKTIVALLAMLVAVEAGGQAAIVAPTEILARQHFDTLAPLGEQAGVRVAKLTGRNKGRARAQLLDELAAGEVDILVGTHALFEEDVRFKSLKLAVIDEQHRFGVHQRLRLTRKGVPPVDVLVMTATPIPRTLVLTAYGDMDVSRLLEKPPGRTPVDTRTVSLSRLDDIVAAVRRAIEGGARVYWVCPLVEESEILDIAAAEERFRHLRELLGERVGMIHGRMKATEKDSTMAAFASGALDLLVATTVIEVGVDVPEATIMVIEHAERFGLAQLHQLRGRVGRGRGQSSCLLLYGHPLGDVARARLGVMRDTDDGFKIAEEDLRLRGAGELLGTRQSGFPRFRLADIEAHGALLQTARDDALLILNREPRLDGPRGAALRVLLYLFERDAAVKYLQSG
ncbi:MAG: ATP-dependent DNA helicase RecG [Sphingomonadales bacterium]